MAIADDFTVSLGGDIRYTGGGSTYYTVLELHRFLQDLADDQEASGNDLIDITSTKPSERSTDNIIELISPYNIDKDASEQLYDGSILQDGGDVLFSGITVVGEVESGTELQIIRNNLIVTSWWSTGINMDAANNILLRTLIQTRQDGVDIDGKRLRVQAREFGDEYGEFSLTAGLGNSTAAIFTGADLNNESVQATVAAWDCSNTEGYQLIDLNDGSGDQPYYSQWDLGTQVDINDIYEFTKDIGRRGAAKTIHTMNGEYFRGITHEFTYGSKSGTISEDDILAWGCSFDFTGATGDFVVGERIDVAISNAIMILIAQDDNGATGTMYCQVVSGTPVNGQTMTGYTSTETADINSVPADVAAVAGTGIILADNASNTYWIQLLTGGPPVNSLPIYSSTNEGTAALTSAVTTRSRTAEFYGTSTGTSVIGNHGIGHLPGDLSDADKLFDLEGDLNQPPNNQIFYVYGCVVGEDYILVSKNDGSDEVDYDQFSLDGAHNSGTQTTITVKEVVPVSTPQTGVIRIEQSALGVYTYQAYLSWTGKIFTISSEDYSGAKAAIDDADVFIGYVDKLATAVTESFTGVYSAGEGSLSLVVKARDGGTAGDNEPIKPYKTPASFGSGGGSATVGRISDA